MRHWKQGRVLLLALALVGCTVEPESPKTAGPTASPSAPTPSPLGAGLVPDDFPRTLGCSDAEILRTPAQVQSRVRAICDAAQIGLYQLSLDTTLDEEEAKGRVQLIAGTTLEMLKEQIDSVTAPTDGGVMP